MSISFEPTTFERDGLKIIVTRVKDVSNEYPEACEIRVQRPHETHIWLDDIKQLVTLRDALSSYIDQQGLEGGEQ